MYEYKEEILSSRVGCLGASDANLIANVAFNGIVPKSAQKRLAVAKGLIEPQDSFTTEAMRLGDDIEMAIYEQLKLEDDRWQSNYKLTSKKYSKPNLSLIAHIDFFLKDDERQIIKIVECKATKTSTTETQQTYKNQLFVEYVLAKELASQLGRKWKVEMALCHYNTNDYDGFDADKITLKKVIFRTQAFDIEKGMTILDDYVGDMEEYYESDEIDAQALPITIKQQFDMMTNIIKEIQERENAVDEFKRKLYNFFLERGIKSVKSDMFSITLVEPTTSTSFDYKRYLAEYEKVHPVKYRRIVKNYAKTTNKRGYIKISLKEQN